MFAAVVVLSLAAPADDPPRLSEAAQKELKRLEGKWKVEKMASAGEETTFKEGDQEKVVEIKGRKWILNGREKGEIVAIDTTTDPKCLDMKSVETGRAGTVIESVYKLDGDTLTICVYEGKGKNRPTSFDTPKEPDTVLAVLKREKK